MNRCLFCYKEIDDGLFHKTCSNKFFGSVVAPILDFSFNEMEELANRIVLKRVSITGVQPKLSLSVKRGDGQTSSRFTIVGLWGDYILKPPTLEYPFMPEIEDCTMHLASLFKISVVPHSLIPLKSGEFAYITKRIDRTSDGAFIHMEDFCQISGKLTEAKYRGSLEGVARHIKRYSSSRVLDLITFFEVILFSYLTGNADMHLKNFSLIHNKNGLITFSPAYDLVATRLLISKREDSEELALSLRGKKSRFKRDDFVLFGEHLGLTKKQIENSFRKFSLSLVGVDPFIDISFLSFELKEEYKLLIKERASRLKLN